MVWFDVCRRPEGREKNEQAFMVATIPSLRLDLAKN
jgi:hypothetical protein